MIDLTTNHKPGDDWPNEPDYTHVRITRFCIDTVGAQLELWCDYGTIVDNAFVQGKSRTATVTIRDTPNNAYYTDLVGASPEDDTTLLYDQVSNALYQWLLDQSVFAGSIV